MTLKVGQTWRDDLDGKLWRVVAFGSNAVWVRRADLHGAAARGQFSIQTHPAYFNGEHWELVDDEA